MFWKNLSRLIDYPQLEIKILLAYCKPYMSFNVGNESPVTDQGNI